VDELVISKANEGRFTNETTINIPHWLAGWHINKIMKSVTIGQPSDNLPVIL
jgi:hypothetical protein